MRAHLLLLTAALMACKGDDGGGKNDGGDVADAGDADTDVDADADVDADTDADTTDSVPTLGTETATAAECTYVIPADVIVVDKELVTADPGNYWVCKNATLSYSGNGATIAIDEGGTLVLSGTPNTVYAEAGADMAVTQAENTFYLELGADLSDDGGTIKFSCTDVILDTANAPNPGC